MNEQLIGAIVIFISAMPGLGIGLACITRRWMPEQYAKSANSAQLQFILGLGLLAISASLVAFGILLPFLAKETLQTTTIALVIAVNIEAFAMVFFLFRALKKTS